VKLTLAAGLFVAASAMAFAQAPAGSSPAQGTSPQRQGSASSPQQNSAPGEQTLTGCLTSSDRIYTLTVLDDSGKPGTTAQTTSYTLAIGTGVDLQPYLNKRVTVKGTEAGPDAQTINRVEMKTPPAPASTGTSGTGAASSNAAPSKQSGSTPTTQTSAKGPINPKAFNVITVQPASGSCGA